MNRNIIVDIVIVIGILAVLSIMIYVSMTIKQEGYLCQTDPLKYASIKLGEANNADAYGELKFYKENSPTVYFDKRGIYDVYFPRAIGSSGFYELNFSRLDDLVIKDESG